MATKTPSKKSAEKKANPRRKSSKPITEFIKEPAAVDIKKSASKGAKRMMTDAEVRSIFGAPGNTANHTTIALPFPMYLAWDMNVKVNKISCHKKIASALSNVLKDILAAYGADKVHSLGIDRFGGCYSFRLMRGSSTRYSRHSWAIAIDLDPDRNQLREDHTTARFARPEYRPMIDAFYRYGFIGLGPEKDYDWMHFEFGI